MKIEIKTICRLMIAVLMATTFMACGEKPTEPITKATINYDIASNAINPANAYLQAADLVSYTASGVGSETTNLSNQSLPWSASAEITLGSGTNLTIGFTDTLNILIHPDGPTKLLNTNFTLTMKKDGNVVKSETFTLTVDDPQRAITWTVN